jgi:hypothetical protein
VQFLQEIITDVVIAGKPQTALITSCLVLAVEKTCGKMSLLHVVDAIYVKETAHQKKPA